MIDYILQIQGQNLLQVVYKSGVNRFIAPDPDGCYGSNMTQTQRDFMSRSMMVILPAEGWNKAVNYYVDRENPNRVIMSAVEAAERRNNRRV